MNPAHGLPVPDFSMGRGVVILRIDIHKSNPLGTITPFQKTDLAHT